MRKVEVWRICTRAVVAVAIVYGFVLLASTSHETPLTRSEIVSKH